jgi:Skp family chaperone for outer membrane proteins
MVVVAMIAAAGASAVLFSHHATAQGTATPAPTVRIASVDILDVVERMVLSDKYKPSRDAFTEAQRTSIQPLIAELQALAQQGQTTPQGTPEFQTLVQQYTEKQQALQMKNEEAQNAIAQFEAKQVGEAYGLVSGAASRMAERMGYTHVFATRSDTDIRSNNVPGVVQEILAHPLVAYPKGDDLTQALITELQLEDVTLPSETPAAPSGVPGAAPGTPGSAPGSAPAPTTPATPANP